MHVNLVNNQSCRVAFSLRLVSDSFQSHAIKAQTAEPMNRTKPNQQFRRLATCVLATVASLHLASSALMAQVARQSATNETERLKPVIVTGSLIPTAETV